MGQEVLEGIEGAGAKVRLSFGGMQVVADREPDFQDPIYLVVGGRISQLKEGPGDEPDFLLATVKGQGRIISKEQFYALMGSRPVPMWDAEAAEAEEVDLEALEAELAEKEASS